MEPQSDEKERSREVEGEEVCGRGKAQRRGGRLRLRAMQGFVPTVQHALLPLTRCGGFTGYRLCRRPLLNLMHGSADARMMQNCSSGVFNVVKIPAVGLLVERLESSIPAGLEASRLAGLEVGWTELTAIRE